MPNPADDIRKSLEAQALAVLEASIRPMTEPEMEYAVAEHFRRLGIPAVKARKRPDEDVFDITVVLPKGE